MLITLKHYLSDNLLRGIMTSPFHAPLRAWSLVPFFVLSALLLGLGPGPLRWDPVLLEWTPLIILRLLVTPTIIEEVVYRGLLIPREIRQRGATWVALAIGWSTVPYVVSHPLSALTLNPETSDYFLDPAFLVIITLLGVTCGHSYAVSRSLWCPIVIHWVTVLAWIFLFGGYELLLGLM